VTLPHAAKYGAYQPVVSVPAAESRRVAALRRRAASRRPTPSPGLSSPPLPRATLAPNERSRFCRRLPAAPWGSTA